MKKKATQITPKEASIDLIKHYVLRGDSLQSLRVGGMGSYSSLYHAQIGGWLTAGEEKHYGPDWILVLKVGRHEVRQVFSLEKIYNEIKSGRTQQTLF